MLYSISLPHKSVDTEWLTPQKSNPCIDMTCHSTGFQAPVYWNIKYMVYDLVLSCSRYMPHYAQSIYRDLLSIEIFED